MREVGTVWTNSELLSVKTIINRTLKGYVSMDEDKCLRCGQCCFMPDSEGRITTEPCKHLVFNEDEKTFCNIYETRIGTHLGDKIVCGLRCKDRFDYENCPYNKGEKLVYSVNRNRVRRVFWQES
jgi:hypothetical protein